MQDLVGIVVAAYLSACLCGFLTDKHWEKEAIAHNAAHYEQTTGNFTWNNPAKEQKQ